MTPCPAWPKESLIGRLLRCRTMLSIHGCLSDVERRLVVARIAKLDGRLERERLGKRRNAAANKAERRREA